MDSQSKGVKRVRTVAPASPGSSEGRDQLLLVSIELQNHLGKKYCDESDLLPLLLAHGFVRRVRTIEIEVRPLGGDNFKVSLDVMSPSVGEAKAEIARAQGTSEDQQELYKVNTRADGGVVREDDAEPELLDDEEIQLADGEVVAMAVKELPLAWKVYPAEHVTLSLDETTVTHNCDIGDWDRDPNTFTRVTTREELSTGKHYWEVELLSDVLGIYIGICKPNLSSEEGYPDKDCQHTWWMRAYSGGLFGHGKLDDDRAGRFEKGDRVGMLLNFEDGSLRFFKNGVKHGSGYPSGSVEGPVLHAVLMDTEGHSARLHAATELPTAEQLTS
jgi:hypothetical protein